MRLISFVLFVLKALSTCGKKATVVRTAARYPSRSRISWMLSQILEMAAHAGGSLFPIMGG
jgi:hypothetical protein